jgi:Ricin-type beta-trefoil lectin domain-like
MFSITTLPRWLALSAALLLATVGAVAAVPAHADAAVSDGIYRIHTGASNWGQVLDVAGSSTAANTQIVQWDPLNGANQKFRVTRLGADAFGPYYRLSPLHAPGMCLDVIGASTAGIGEVAQIFGCHDGTNQQFYLPAEPFGNPGIGKIVPRHSRLPLGLDNGSRGTVLRQRASWDLKFANQWFAMHRIG